MKKLNLKVVACLLAGAVMCSSCIGSFNLFNNYAKWQRNMTDNKFVNAIVGFILMPIVGGICLFVDSVVLNTVEFWTGDNPVHQANVGKSKQVMGSDGRYYTVTNLKDGYEVKAPTGELSFFKYDKKNNSWSLEQNGQVRELFRFNADGTMTTVMNGKQLTVRPDEAGLYQVRMEAGDGRFFAMR